MPGILAQAILAREILLQGSTASHRIGLRILRAGRRGLGPVADPISSDPVEPRGWLRTLRLDPDTQDLPAVRTDRPPPSPALFLDCEPRGEESGTDGGGHGSGSDGGAGGGTDGSGSDGGGAGGGEAGGGGVGGGGVGGLVGGTCSMVSSVSPLSGMSCAGSQAGSSAWYCGPMGT
jgi:hypothetical protein